MDVHFNFNKLASNCADKSATSEPKEERITAQFQSRVFSAADMKTSHLTSQSKVENDSKSKFFEDFEKCVGNSCEAKKNIVKNMGLLKKFPQLINYKNSNGLTPLLAAAVCNLWKEASMMLQHQPYADVNALDLDGCSVVLHAVNCNKQNVVEMLLNGKEVNLNIVPNKGILKGFTPLFLAAKKCQWDIVKLLLTHRDRIDFNISADMKNYMKYFFPLLVAADKRWDIFKEMQIDESGFSKTFNAINIFAHVNKALIDKKKPDKELLEVAYCLALCAAPTMIEKMNIFIPIENKILSVLEEITSLNAAVLNTTYSNFFSDDFISIDNVTKKEMVKQFKEKCPQLAHVPAELLLQKIQRYHKFKFMQLNNLDFKNFVELMANENVSKEKLQLSDKEFFLYDATTCGDLKFMKFLISDLQKINRLDILLQGHLHWYGYDSTSIGKTVLHCAAEHGFIEIARCLVEACPQLLATRDATGELPGVTANKDGHKELAQYLVRASLQLKKDTETTTRPVQTLSKDSQINKRPLAVLDAKEEAFKLLPSRAMQTIKHTSFIDEGKACAAASFESAHIEASSAPKSKPLEMKVSRPAEHLQTERLKPLSKTLSRRHLTEDVLQEAKHPQKVEVGEHQRSLPEKTAFKSLINSSETEKGLIARTLNALPMQHKLEQSAFNTSDLASRKSHAPSEIKAEARRNAFESLQKQDKKKALKERRRSLQFVQVIDSSLTEKAADAVKHSEGVDTHKEMALQLESKISSISCKTLTRKSSDTDLKRATSFSEERKVLERRHSLHFARPIDGNLENTYSKQLQPALEKAELKISATNYKRLVKRVSKASLERPTSIKLDEALITSTLENLQRDGVIDYRKEKNTISANKVGDHSLCLTIHTHSNAELWYRKPEVVRSFIEFTLACGLNLEECK